MFFNNHPAPPEYIAVSSITSDSAVVSWSPVKNAGDYEVVWTKKGVDVYSLNWTSDNHIKLSDLVYDEVYTVKVRVVPYNNVDETYESDYVSKDFKTLKDIPSAGELARPSNVNAQFDKAKTTVKISWDAVEGASYYDVSLEGHDSYDSYWTIFKVIKTVPATQTECVYAEAVAGPYIYIKVAARDSDFSDSCRWSKDFVLEL